VKYLDFELTGTLLILNAPVNQKGEAPMVLSPSAFDSAIGKRFELLLDTHKQELVGSGDILNDQFLVSDSAVVIPTEDALLFKARILNTAAGREIANHFQTKHAGNDSDAPLHASASFDTKSTDERRVTSSGRLVTMVSKASLNHLTLCYAVRPGSVGTAVRMNRYLGQERTN